MANYPEAEQYFGQQFAYLTERRADESRAAEGKDPAYEVLFLEE